MIETKPNIEKWEYFNKQCFIILREKNLIHKVNNFGFSISKKFSNKKNLFIFFKDREKRKDIEVAESENYKYFSSKKYRIGIMAQENSIRIMGKCITIDKDKEIITIELAPNFFIDIPIYLIKKILSLENQEPWCWNHEEVGQLCLKDQELTIF